MLEISACGGRVLMLRSVEFARNHHVPLHVRSSFTWEPGTWVTEEDATMEQAVVTAVAHDDTEAKVTVTGVPDHPGVAARHLPGSRRPVGQRRHDRAEHLASTGRPTSRSPSPASTSRRASRSHEDLVPESAPERSSPTSTIAKVALIGAGMRSHPGVSATMFETLANEGINIEMISTSPIRISCVVASDPSEQAVRALHEAFDLGNGR